MSKCLRPWWMDTDMGYTEDGQETICISSGELNATCLCNDTKKLAYIRNTILTRPSSIVISKAPSKPYKQILIRHAVGAIGCLHPLEWHSNAAGTQPRSRSSRLTLGTSRLPPSSTDKDEHRSILNPPWTSFKNQGLG